MDAKGHFKPSFAEKFLYLGCDKTLQHIKYHTVALWQAAKMSIRGSCKGTFGGVNTISHFGSVWNTRTSIFPILTKTGMEVLTVTSVFFPFFFFFYLRRYVLEPKPYWETGISSKSKRNEFHLWGQSSPRPIITHVFPSALSHQAHNDLRWDPNPAQGNMSGCRGLICRQKLTRCCWSWWSAINLQQLRICHIR